MKNSSILYAFSVLVTIHCACLNAFKWDILLQEYRMLTDEIHELHTRIETTQTHWDLSDDDDALENFYVLYDQLNDRLQTINRQLKQICGNNIVFFLRNSEIGE